MDHISNLPKHILHDILSRLPEKDAARTSILSKSWKYTWSSFPMLVFDELRCFKRKREYNFMRRREFIDSVHKTLLRFRGQSLAVKQFKLIADLGDDIYTSIDFWMQLLAESDIQVLHLRHDFCGEKLYSLPRCILEVKSLTKLILSGKFMFDQTLLRDQICFPSLQVLSLVDVRFEDETVFHNFISSCPCIEYLTLDRCHKLKPVNSQGVPRFVISDIEAIAKIYLDFPNVEKCSNLRCLSLGCVNEVNNAVITDQWLLQLFDKFPHLESLELKSFFLSKKITVTSLRLKVLKLTECYNCMVVLIHAPSMYLCDLRADYFTMPAITFVNNSSQLKVNVQCQLYSCREDFVRLREFLQSFEPKNVLATLTLVISEGSLHFDINGLPRIKYLALTLSSFSSENFCLPVIAALLWVCCPTNISMKLSPKPYDTTFAKVLCKKLVGRDDCFCKPKTIRCWFGQCESSQIKFWWHGLGDVKIRSSSLEGGNYIHYKNLLNALSTLPPGEDISFS